MTGVTGVLLFPGQGSQTVGMGNVLMDRSAAARRVFEIVDDAVGESFLEVCRSGPATRLNRTSFAQPALFATALAAHASWREQRGSDDVPVACAGHSAGALAAAVAAGYLTLEDGARLVAKRGQLMESAPGDGSMLAVASGAERESELVALATKFDLVVAARNGARQIVLSGPKASIIRAKAALGGKAKELVVSHAFHSPMMASVQPIWAEIVDATTFHPSPVRYVRNLDGAAVFDPEYVREDLREALTSPVNWTSVMETAQAWSPWLSFGPARALNSMARHQPDAPRIEVAA